MNVLTHYYSRFEDLSYFTVYMIRLICLEKERGSQEMEAKCLREEIGDHEKAYL